MADSDPLPTTDEADAPPLEIAALVQHAAAQQTCPLCEIASPLLAWAPPGSSCTHAYCAHCTVNIIRLELGVDDDGRLCCPVPECRATIAAASLEAAASLPGDDSCRPLSADALVRARARLQVARKRDASGRAAQLTAVLGRPCVVCPNPTCDAVVATDAHVETAVGRLILCEACAMPLCVLCGAGWADSDSSVGIANNSGYAGARPAPTHSGKTCAEVARSRAAAAAEAAAKDAASSRAAASSAAADLALLDVLPTLKQCLQCGEGISHYRGHACHHISPGPRHTDCMLCFVVICTNAFYTPLPRPASSIFV